MPRTRKAATTQVHSVKHKDKRANIPTGELSRFVADDEKAPKTILYARDPSLDPQLVWKGKDEQDSAPLEVPAVPVYIQEKIQPQALIENLRDTATAGQKEPELTLFDDFNGQADFETKVDFYHHESNWSNRMILGDSLLVMTSLAEKEGLKGKVQMIYLDPPYGIRFGSNWQVSTRKRDVKDGKAEDATRQPEQVKAFRDTWELGIHSYLAYLRDRLSAARELLTETGSIFVQIGDQNLHLVRSLMDEVFGSESFVSIITFKKTSGATGEFLPGTCDYVLWYAKSIDELKFRQSYREREIGGLGGEAYTGVEEPNGRRRRLTASEIDEPEAMPKDAKVFRLQIVTSQRLGRPSGPGSAMYFPVHFRGRDYVPQGSRGWTTTADGMGRLVVADRIETTAGSINYVRYHQDFPVFPLTNLWEDTQSGSGMDKTYIVQTNVKVVERCLLMTTDPGDLVLDPTCGSGTTAYVAEQWGRRWITIDTSRVALTLARTRLMAARYPYYLLSDSEEGVMKEAETTGRVPGSAQPALSGLSKGVSRASALAAGTAALPDVRKGFVYRRVPHITLKSIANNEEIDAIHARWQEKLEPIRAALNAAVAGVGSAGVPGSAGVSPASGTAGVPPAPSQRSKEAAETAALPGSWEEWQIPREADKSWPKEAVNLHEEWWKLRRERQKEIDDSIARHADTELLYDQPYEDNKRIRVSGPFTVESLSPHRVLATDEGRPASEKNAQAESGPGQFETMIIENLRKAGVQNTVRQERLRFDRLEGFPGTYVQASGEYTEGDTTRRVAVCIGPEHGTVGPDLIKDAAKEALQGIGFDLLLVCGFAFDPHAGEAARQINPESLGTGEFAVAESAKQYGRLPVLLVRMNPDLAMGDELLKKTGAGNLFMVFGEPDVDIRPVGESLSGLPTKSGRRQSAAPTKDGAPRQWVVEIKGLDVYDPTTGQIRSHTTDDIACWFIDTNYDGESFFVRHAYFTGADEPYEKLKRALRAEIDEAAWASLYSTISRPFDPPATGKIAIKVINHYGDEVLKVCETNW